MPEKASMRRLSVKYLKRPVLKQHLKHCVRCKKLILSPGLPELDLLISTLSVIWNLKHLDNNLRSRFETLSTVLLSVHVETFMCMLLVI